MTITVDVFPLPSHWASAVINGDYSGLDDNECALCQAELEMFGVAGWDFVDIEGEPYFTWDYRRYGGDAEGGEVADFVAVQRQSIPG